MTPPPELWQAAITWLATHAVIPAVHWLDIAQAAGDPREIAEAVLIAGLQLFLIAGVMRPLESLYPAERWSDWWLTTADRKSITWLFYKDSFSRFAHGLGGASTHSLP